MRLPVAPLLRASGCLEASSASSWAADDSPDCVLARRLGYSGVAEMARSFDWYRMKREGLTWQRADQFACALNLHPMEVWGDAWLEAQDGPSTWGTGKLKAVRKEPRWGLIGAEMGAVA